MTLPTMTEVDFENYDLRRERARWDVLTAIGQRLEAPAANSRKDGAKRAHVGRSVASGPARAALLPIALAAVIGVVLWVLVFALGRWIWGLIFGGGEV